MVVDFGILANSAMGNCFHTRRGNRRPQAGKTPALALIIPPFQIPTRQIRETAKNSIMPKQKTHKGMKKRYKLTATGKVKHRKRGRGHLLSSKSSKRKRHLRQDAVIGGVWAKNIAHGLAPGL
jgi:large subunit ribosomal protein L35